MSIDSLPKSVQSIVELCGLDAAMALVDFYGGRQIVIPYGTVKGSTRANLVRLMGIDAAEIFMGHYGGEYLTIAKCSAALRDVRDRKMLEEFEGGMSAARIAVRHGMTERNVKYRLKRVPGGEVPGLPSSRSQEDDKQLGLF
jgi:hypothetical protein